MAKINSLWNEKGGLEDPCELMDKSLICFKKSDLSGAVSLWWKAACTNIAMIPRLLMHEEIDELGDKIDQDESFTYMNANWGRWKDKHAFTALSVFWMHIRIRKALGLRLAENIGLSGSPDLEIVEKDISDAVYQKTEESNLIRKAVNILFENACFIREIDKKNIAPPHGVLDKMAQLNSSSSELLQLCTVEAPTAEMRKKLLNNLTKAESVQRELFMEVVQTHEIAKMLGDDISYIG